MTKLIVFDMDGVIFEHFNFWLELHKKWGTYEEGMELTEKYLKTDYPKLVEEVIGRLWKGKSEKEYMELVDSVQYVKGAEEVLKELKQRGFKIAIISSGPKELAERAQKECGVDYIYTNELIFEGGKVLGTTDMKYWPIRMGNKAEALRKLCVEHHIDYKDVIVVVHEENDIKMAKTAGFAIGFCPTSEELKKYCRVVVEKNDLREILEYVG